MDQEKIGKFIREIRKRNNLTQKDLADKYNVTYQAVSKWENGKNLPDALLIKQMSKDFNISLDDFFDGEYKKTSTNKKIFLVIPLIFIVIVLIGIIIINKDNDFEFKTIKSNCSSFNISGIISYNDSKSSIYISHVSYCGNDSLEKYRSIECTLYETNNAIDTYNYHDTNKITLEEFLNKVTFTIDNYKKVCKDYSKDSLYLEINASNDEYKSTTYKVPLKLESECK